MALNMSKDSDSDRQTESPGHISDNDIIEEDKDEPINLHQNGRSSAVGSGSDGETSPASPSSDAGMSTSSAKEQKASRLENIVGGLARSTSSPLPPQGCKKRKLYQPVQHDVNDDETKENEMQEEPEQKRMKDGLENHIKSMQDQFQKMQQKFHNHNDENADPEDSELQIDLSHEEKKIQREEITIERRVNPKSFSAFGHPILNGSAEPLPLPPSTLNPNYMDLAKRFLQEQQDKVTKELITKDIVHSTIGKNEIENKLAAISPELEGLADILKSEITTSLTIIVDSIVQRFLTQKRQPLGKFSEDSMFNQDKPRTPSGRAPQVRDRSTPRSVVNPLSMANPLSLSNALNTSNNLIMTGSTAPPRISFPASVSGDMPTKPPMMSLYAPSTNGQLSEDEREEESEQDDALNLVVTPKKKRHKVTDTRITPRTVSRLLGEQPSMAELQKHFGPASPFMPPGFHMPKLLGDLPRPPFHGIPNSFLPHIPTSLTMSNPSLNHPDHFPFSPFGFPGPLNRPRDLSPPRDHHRPRSASPPRDHRPPPQLLHPAILAAQSHQSHQSPDFSHMRHHHNDIDNRPASETSSDDFKFEKMEFGSSQFSLGNMSGGYSLSDSHNSTLTPMHLRKAKLMFFWVRYPSSAILKMYFPDIKFNKNNTAQLVKWFSNFREFYYIQMEKYARQALSEGIKNAEDLRVSVDSELYRVLNLHYNRNNHIEVPDHFLPVIEAALREFMNSIKCGKDAEPSWKKQIYKIIARYDESIPEYFKTQEFLQQLE
eukprot:TRINITY_DN9510_c0_g1_i1.p1 TRINITY_DN9510_c0_g1~~TRINITY_DN9510_c0_g1_i1.p1  ORF type:complete len:906 (-),score=219.41 TRINITY_DN9510_c0_g1_i1:1251-3563(-)